MSNRAESPSFDEIWSILKKVSVGHKLAEKELFHGEPQRF